MEILDLRHFSSHDLSPLLDDEIQLWSRLLSWDYSSSAAMILRYVDAKILPGYAAVERGRIFGYAFFVYEGSKGVIGDLFVANGGRLPDPRAVEEQLLTHVIETLQQSPGVHRVEAQLLTHESGEVITPVHQPGIPTSSPRIHAPAAGQRNSKDRPTARRNRNPPLVRAGLPGRRSVITSAYRGHVDAEINDQYRSLSGSLRFLNNIVRFPGCGTFDPESSFVAINRQARTVVGVILCSRVRQDVGHVTQVCVVPEYRLKGIGESLLAATVANLRQRKFTLLSLTVTEANHRAIELYERIGFERKRIFDAFVWEG